jgi:hypothetical protein
MLTRVSFVAIKEYLNIYGSYRADGRADRQTEVINNFQLSLEKKRKLEVLKRVT